VTPTTTVDGGFKPVSAGIIFPVPRKVCTSKAPKTSTTAVYGQPAVEVVL